MNEDRVKKFVDQNYEEFMKTHMGIEGPFELKSEYTLSNGQQVDKVIFGQDKKILALIECKGTIGTNEFVRGFGQTYQGKHQISENGREEFAEGAKSFLLLPFLVASKVNLNSFNLSDIEMVFVNENETTTKYSKKGHIYRLEDKWMTVNPYYFRDSSLEGLFIVLRLMSKQSGQSSRLNLTQIEKKIKEIKSSSGIDFFGDIRNNRIVPSHLGFFNEATKEVTLRGYDFARKNFEDFAKAIVLDELGEYSRIVFSAIMFLIGKSKEDDDGFYEIPTKDIVKKILEIFDNKNITYLLDPDEGNRNILTMIRMLRTIGSIDFVENKGGKNMGRYKINYIPISGLPFKMSDFGKFDSDKLEQWLTLLDLPSLRN